LYANCDRGVETAEKGIVVEFWRSLLIVTKELREDETGCTEIDEPMSEVFGDNRFEVGDALSFVDPHVPYVK
jgi:hypothetical protein